VWRRRVVESASVRGHAVDKVLLAGMHEAEAAHHLQDPVVVPVRLLLQLAGLEAAAAGGARRLRRFAFIVAADTEKNRENRQSVVLPADRKFKALD
jgi:hypothetical protein